jgi:hypothetical protein
MPMELIKLEISTDAGNSYTELKDAEDNIISAGNGEILNWSTNITVPPNSVADTRSIRIRAIDGYDKQTEKNFSVKFDSVAPILTISNLVNEQKIFTNNFNVTGSWTDQGGSGTTGGLAKIEVQEGAKEIKSISPTASSWNYNFTGLTQSLNQTFKFKTTDAIGNSSETQISNIVIDYEDPVLTVSGTAGLTYINSSPGKIDLNVTAQDSLAIDKLVVVAKKNGVLQTGDGFSTGIFYEENYLEDLSSEKTWAKTITENGEWEFIITVTDKSGKNKSVTRNIVLDSVKPELSLSTNLEPHKYGLINISGPISDNIGLDYAEYQLENGSWETALITSDGEWKGAIELLTEGTFNLNVRVFDKAGNSNLLVKENILVDKENPLLTETSVATESALTTNSEVVFTGKASDTNALSKLEVSKNEVVTDITGTIDGDNNWTYTLPNLAGGTFNFIFTATDVVGRTSVINRTVVMDITKPSAPELTPSFGAYEETSITIVGTSSDNLTDGVSKVEYSFDNSNWTQVTGTSSWSRTIDISSLVDGSKTLYLRATDKAGNISDNTEANFVKDTVNPTITVTGYDGTVYKKEAFTIEGAVSDNLSLGLAPVEITVKIGETPVDLSSNPITFTGEGTTKTYSQTVPVTGGEGVYVVSITGIDAVGRTITTTRSVTVDNQKPTVTVDNLADNQLFTGTSYIVSGESADVGASGLSKVEYTLDGTNWILASTSDLFSSWTINMVGLADTLTGNFRIRAVDRAGNIGDTTSIPFKVSTSKPTTTIVGVDTTFKYVKEAVTISGTASDGNGITSVAATSSFNGAEAVPLTVTGELPVWSADLPTDEGVYDITITVTDGAGETSTFTRSVAIDTSSPDLEITAPITTTIVGTNSYELRGTVTDNGGKGVTLLEYSRDNIDWDPITVSGLIWMVPGINFSSTVGAETTQGVRTLYVRATDGLNTATTKTVSFNFDTAPPVLTETTVGNATELITNSAIVFTGKASDTNALSKLEVSINGGAPIEITVDVDGADNDIDTLEDNNTWTYTLPNTEDGSFALVFTATDAAGRQTTLTRNILMDATKPVLPVITSSPGDYVGNSYAIFGNTSDETSGIKKVEYSLNNTNWYDVNGTDNWSQTINLGSLNEGENLIYIRSTDKANNVSLVNNQVIKKDLSAPTITETSVATESALTTNSEVVFTGKASDTNALSKLEVSKNGTVTDITGTIDGDNNWTYTLPNLAGGTFNFIFTATDVVGRTSVINRTVVMDITKPSAPVLTSSFGAYEETSITIVGTSSDNLTDGVSKVEYSFDNSTWTQVTGTSSWSRTIDISSLVDGSKTLYLRATDKAGNISDNTEANFVKDTVNPTITVTGYDGTVYKKEAFTIEGAVSDNLSLGLAPVEITVKIGETPVDLSSNPITFTGEGTTKTYSQTVPVTGGEGVYVVSITGIDAVGRTITTTRSVTVDNQKPTVTVDNLADNQLFTGTSYSVSGESADVGASGLSKVEYTLDGTNWILASTSDLFSSWTINMVGLADTLTGNFRIRAVDRAGNIGDTTSIPFKVSTSKPTTTIVGVDTTFKYVKEAVTISGTASDGNGITSVAATSSFNGAEAVPLTVTGELPVWSADLPTDEGVYDITITVTDGAGETSTFTRSVAIDTSSPDLEITAPITTTIVGTNSYELRGTVTDNGGKGVTLLEYSRDNIDWDPITVSGLIWMVPGINFSSTVGAETTQGVRTLYVRATDGLNTATTKTVSFNFDTAPPVLTETTVGNATELITNSAIVFTGKASDTNALSKLEVSINGGAPIEITVDVDGADNDIDTLEDNNTWTYTLPNTEDGSFALVFTATDAAGRQTTLTRNILMDATKPVLPVITSSPGDYVGNSYAIFGNTSDETSGIKKVEYSLNNTNWYDVNGTDNWSQTINLGSLNEGENLIYIRSTDKADNVSLVNNQVIKKDLSAPTITETSVATESALTTNSEVVFTGKASDTNALSKLEVSKNGTVTDITGTIDGDNNWTYTLPNLAGGTFNFIFTATDVVGRTSVINRTVVMDITKPSAPVLTSSFGAYEETSITIVGTSSDNLTDGVSKVEYSFDNSTWTQVTGTSSWSRTIDISSLVDGSKTLYLRATDKAGNISDNTEANFVKDTVNPTITVTGYDGTVYKKEAFTIEGAVSDNLSLGLAPVEITVKIGETPVDLSSNPITFTGEGTTKTYSQTVPVTGGEGVYVVSITGIDAVGRTITTTRSVTVDNQKPTVTVDNLADNQLFTGTSYSVSGESADVGASGLSKVEYTLDGTNWILASTSDLFSSWTINMVGLADTLTGNFRIRAVDRAGNIGDTTSIPFKVSTSKPTTTIVGVDTTFKYVKEAVTISGTASDGNGITSVAATSSFNGAEAVPLTVTGELPVWSADLPTDEGVYDITITVTDGAGETSTFTRSVAIDTSSPELEIGRPGNSESFISSIIILSGSAVDLGVGLDEASLMYSLNGAGFVNTNLVFSGSSWTVANANIGASEGSKSLVIRGNDKLGNSSTSATVNFFYDVAPPVLEETSIDTTDTIFSKNATVSLGGTITDTNAVALANGVTITATRGGSAITAPTVTYTRAGDGKSANWTSTPDISTDGLYIFTITGTDIAGKTHVIQRTVRRDTVAPETLTVTTDLTAWSRSTIFNVEGTADDADSGLATLEYQVNGGGRALLSGTSSWNGTFTIPNGSTNQLTIVATDKAGNERTVTVNNIKVDTSLPEITLVSPSPDVTKKVNGASDL